MGCFAENPQVGEERRLIFCRLEASGPGDLRSHGSVGGLNALDTKTCSPLSFPVKIKNKEMHSATGWEGAGGEGVEGPGKI